MPEMDGFETTSRIRAKERQAGGHIQVVAMTAHAMKGDRERCLAAGMDAYVSKPIKADELYAVLGRVQRTDAPQKSDDRPSEAEPERQRPLPPPHSALDPEAVVRLRSLADDGGASFLTAVVEAFLQDSKQRLADLREASSAAAPDRLRTSAHALKGASREVGATRVAEICQRLEDMGGSHTTEGAGDLLIRLNQELKDVQSELKRQVAEEAL